MIVVTGGRGLLGAPLLQALAVKKHKTLSISRTESDTKRSVCWDLNQAPDYAVFKQLRGIETLIHCAPLWLLPQHLPSLHGMGLKKIIAFSSSSIEGKASSQNAHEQALVEQLQDAESALTEFAQTHQLQLAILRPSMIYGYAKDENVTHLARFIEKRGFAVVAGPGAGLRQPVHVDDLVSACVKLLAMEIPHPLKLTLAGAERLSYREMLERIAAGLNKPARIISLPVFLFRTLLSIAGKFGSFHYTAAMADRMNQDLIYDTSEAEQKIGFSASAFLSNPARDLGPIGQALATGNDD